ncbi:MAG: hypothetical protein MUC86_00685 [Burkholderiaceae bacterium]|jgi:hypothetical protein|nr:hypothetical protein [Burkholderiaceae bacterium]
MQDRLRALLLESLARCSDPLCLDLDPPAAALRSSNSLFLRPLSLADAAELAADLKRAASLDPTLDEPQSGTLDFDRSRFQINCCPQFVGEIITLHRLDL